MEEEITIEEETIEEKLSKMLETHPELKKLADFSISEGNIVYELKIEPKKFDVAFEDYFFLKNHPEDENAQFIDKFYEDIYKEVLKWCNESKEYTIDCWQDRYTVQKIADIEQIHYNAMSDEEKKAYDERIYQEKVAAKRAERDNLLESIVDPIIMNPLRWSELSKAEQEQYKSYRKYLLNIPQSESFPDIEIQSFDEFID